MPGSPFACSSDPYRTVFTPDRRFLFTGGNLDTTISTYNFNSVNVNVTALTDSPFGAGAENSPQLWKG